MELRSHCMISIAARHAHPESQTVTDLPMRVPLDAGPDAPAPLCPSVFALRRLCAHLLQPALAQVARAVVDGRRIAAVRGASVQAAQLEKRSDALRAEAKNDGAGLVAQVALVPELLARVCVGDLRQSGEHESACRRCSATHVQLDEGALDAEQRVAQGDGRVCVCAGIDDDCAIRSVGSI